MDNTIRTKTIGIIGYGNFGKVVSNYLFPENQCIIYSEHPDGKEFPKQSRIVKNIEEITEKSDIIIPTVPIRNFKEIIKEISISIKPQTVVMDVCSVKEYPVKVMQEILPENIHIIATHPMFGPNSLLKRNYNLKKLPLVLYNVRADKTIYDNIKIYFNNLGINTIEMDPSEHDRLSASSQFFSLLIGEIGKSLQIKHTSIDTPGAEAIINALEYMGADRKIIEDMITYNTYCAEVLDKTISILKRLNN